MKHDDAEKLAELRAIAGAEKIAAASPPWAVNEHKNSRRISLSCPLWIDGVLASGLRLEMFGPEAVTKDRPFAGLRALMFVTLRDKNWHLGRIEFDPENPLKPHRNPMNDHGAPPVVRGPQHHPFQANADLGLSALSPDRDLPLAFPLDTTCTTFNDILKVIRDHFIIPDLWLEEPGWSRTLL